MTLDLTIIAAKVLELTPTQYFKNIKLNATTITKKKKKKSYQKRESSQSQVNRRQHFIETPTQLPLGKRTETDVYRSTIGKHIHKYIHMFM